MKFRLSRNPTKFKGVTRFREINSTVKSVLSSVIYKMFDFPTEITILPFLKKIEFFFLGSTFPIYKSNLVLLIFLVPGSFNIPQPFINLRLLFLTLLLI